MIPDHPFGQLTPDYVLNAIDATGHRTDGRLLALNSYENRVYQVGIEDQQPLIAKFYRPERWSIHQIQEEHDFSIALADAEWPIAAPIKNTQGQTLLQYDDFLIALFERKGGHAPELDNLDNLEVLGRSIGRLHALAKERNFHYRPSIDIASYGIDSRSYLLENHCIPASLLTAYKTLSSDLIELITGIFSTTDFQSIRLHGDCHPGNILWRDDAPLFVDFDDCRSGPAVQDIWMLLSGERQEQELQLDAILEGYDVFCEFDNRELALIESLRTLRLMYFATWLARRWSDPAFPLAFPWFNTERYWAEHINDLRAQYALLQEPPVRRL